MQQLKLKVCGMKELDNIREVEALRPDYLGFIFYNKSSRFVGDDFVLTHSQAKKVGVFVDEDIHQVVALVSQYNLDYVQLHGFESPKYCSTLKEFGLKLIKAFSVDEDFDFTVAKVYEPYVEFFLFDAKGINRGGNGISFDWKLIKNYHGSIPFFLSGGIGPDNIKDVKHLSHPLLHAIDINSGVEVSPGLKNAEKIKTLIAKLKSS